MSIDPFGPRLDPLRMDLADLLADCDGLEQLAPMADAIRKVVNDAIGLRTNQAAAATAARVPGATETYTAADAAEKFGVNIWHDDALGVFVTVAGIGERTLFTLFERESFGPPSTAWSQGRFRFFEAHMHDGTPSGDEAVKIAEERVAIYCQLRGARMDGRHG